MNHDHIRSTNLRFNLEKESQRRAWEYLQGMDKAIFKSYSNAIALALVDYFSHYYKTQDDPYLETREREERSAGFSLRMYHRTVHQRNREKA